MKNGFKTFTFGNDTVYDSEDEEMSTSSSSDSSRNEEQLVFLLQRNKRHCIKGYYENVVSSYCDAEFITHFCISRGLYEKCLLSTA